MRLWNLSSFNEMQEPILQRNVVSAEQRREPRVHSKRSRSLKMVVHVAALAAATLTVTAAGTSRHIIIPESTQFLAVNAEYPTLDNIFADRFAEDWTRDHENELLARMVKNKGSGRNDSELLNLVHSSQQESLASDVRRLSSDDVRHVLRRKA